MKRGYRLLYTCVLVSIVLAGAGSLLGIAEVTAGHILVSLAVILYCFEIQLLNGKGRLVCVALTAVFFVVITAAAGTERCGVFLSSWIRWMSGAPGWVEEWSMIYELLQAGIIAACCYLMQLIMEKYIVIKVISADIVVSLLLFCLLTEWKLSHMGVVVSIAYIVMVYAEWVQREWKKTGSGDRQKYMLWIMPFVALYFVLMLLMPTPENPYEWRFVREKYAQIRDSFMSLAQNLSRGGGEEFDASLSGFSEEGELGDEIEENDREVMTLTRTGKPTMNVYLTGRIYDTFDGRSWLQKNHDTAEDPFRDAVQIQKAVRSREDDYMSNYLSETTLLIRYTHLRTACLFTPLKTRRIQMQGVNNPYFLDGDNLLFQKKRGYGTEYEATYYQLNVGANLFDQFLRSADPGDTDEEQIRRVYDVYTDGIALSEETSRYLEEVAGNAYDRLDWLRKIEQELASFTYTKQPEKLPEDAADAATFLDYFLLESREGYCTHFATAFVLLARSQGMPARYVQGFCVPMRGAGEVSVYNNMAHAWPEVYFEGVGWIPFEPTPGYGRLRYTPWETEQKEGNIEGSQEEILRKEERADDPVSGNVPEAEEENGNSTWRFLRTILYAVAAVCVTGFLFLVIQRIFRRRRYRRMDVTGRFRVVAAVNMRILGMLGFRRNESETLQEFRKHIVRGKKGVSCRLQFIEDYEKLLYGEKAAEPEMLESALEERKELIKLLKEKKKWRYYLFYYRVTIP